MKKPVVVIPLGDIAGVGPEIVVKSLSDPETYAAANPLVVGEREAVARAIEITGAPLKIHVVEHAAQAAFTCGVLDLIDLKNVDARSVGFGTIQAAAGRAAFEFIEKSVQLIEAGEADAVATTPINKEALKAAGIHYIGHTEIFGGLSHVEDPMTMFQVRNLKVFFLTRHLSLKDAVASINREGVRKYITRCDGALRGLGIQNPRIAMAALNPHGGEHGLFGTEEVTDIAPAVEDARRAGIDITGPIGADSVFYLALRGQYDAVISLYHDQGHIATKMVDFERTISVTVGLPYIRTSVDHGTAFDIAGKNRVSEVSMTAAIRLAAEYAGVYKMDSSLKK